MRTCDSDCRIDENGGCGGRRGAGAGKGKDAARNLAHWNKFSNVQQAVLELAQALCAPDTMPSYMALRSAGLGPVADAIRSKHGGLQQVAQRLGLQLSSAFAE